MNAESITTWLRAVGVPDGVVSVGAEADNTWCLLRDEHPADDGGVVTWEVFWREQGNRYDWASFSNEQVACHYLFGRLTWAQVSRGAVGLLATESGDKPAAPARSEPSDDDSPKTGPIVLPQGVNAQS
ncbi:MAG TPA: hypothetical protein VGF84_06640 [Micromonosporaceae bacterium]|jgi:hypothetical protein